MGETERKVVETGKSESYFQISRNLFGVMPPGPSTVAFYTMLEGVGRMDMVQTKGTRIAKKVREDLDRLCDEGNLFIPQEDYKGFVSVLGKNLDVVLTADDLEADVAADILKAGMRDRLQVFYSQPLASTMEDMVRATSVFGEFIWAYPAKLPAFADKLDDGDEDVEHGVCVGILATLLHALLFKAEAGELARPAAGYFLHDIGMCPIPVENYRHGNALTPKQRESVQQHPQTGLNIITRIEPKTSLKLDRIKEAVLMHHETADGAGYPKRMKSQSAVGQLCGMADSFVAMISARKYKQRKSPGEALRELASSKRYNPALSARAVAVLDALVVKRALPRP